MTDQNAGDIVGVEKGQEVRKGKAMLQNKTNKNTNCMFDLQGTIMPTVKDTEWLICVCLNMTGSSGCLGPDASEGAVG